MNNLFRCTRQVISFKKQVFQKLLSMPPLTAEKSESKSVLSESRIVGAKEFVGRAAAGEDTVDKTARS